MTQSASPEFNVQRHRRDPRETSRKLARWLATAAEDSIHDGPLPEVTLRGELGSNGVSSETIPIHVDWPAGPDAAAWSGDYVVRVAPAPGDIPVFRTYRLEDQFEVMRLVGELTSAPVPAVRWLEPTGDVLGAPAFVMDAVSGEVPPDVLPYNLGDNWLFDAVPGDQRRLQDATVDVLAQLHEIPGAREKFGFLLPSFPGGTPLRRHLARTRDWYEFAAAGLAPSPLTERALAWLEANVPADEGEPVLSWGDSRIGNILYRDFTPAGVLDWEMAALGPRELDLAWLIFSHRVFEHIAATLGLPGMPHFLHEEDVTGEYERRTGRQVGNLTWYYLYAAVQWAIVFMRTGAGQVHFKEIEMPGDIEELLFHRGLMVQLADAVGARA